MSDTYWARRFNPTKLRDARKRRKWSQRELARRMGVDDATIRKYETGSRTPGFDTLYDLTRTLDIDILELLDGDDEDLRIFRLRVGKHQDAVAREIGVIRQMYQKIEARKRPITRARLPLLARALNADESDVEPHVDVSDR